MIKRDIFNLFNTRVVIKVTINASATTISKGEK